MSILFCETVASAGLGPSVRREGSELLWRCPHPENHKGGDDADPSLKINPTKNVWSCFVCGARGKGWALAAFIAGVTADDRPAVSNWLREHGLITAGNGRRPRKRVAEFYYSENLRKVRIEPGMGGRSKTFIWEHFKDGEWQLGDGGLAKPFYTNRVFETRDQLDTVLAFEGEAKADCAGKMGIPAFSFKDGLTLEQCSRLAGLDVVLWPDADPSGSTQVMAAAKVMAESKQPRCIRRIEPPQDLKPGEDIIDAVIKLGFGKNKIDALIREARPFAPDPAQANVNHEPHETEIETVRGDEITPKVMEWLWENRILSSHLAAFVGPPDVGKDCIGVDFIARLTTGTDFPDGRKNAHGAFDVVVLASEESLEDTVVPRLKVAGADLTRIHFAKQTIVTNKSKKIARKIALDTDIAAVRDLFHKQPEAKMLYISPLGSYLGKLKKNSDDDVRPVLDKLRELAEELGIVILYVMHFNKNQLQSAIDRTGGAGAFIQVPRCVWAFTKDDQDETGESRLMLAVKLNNVQEKDKAGLRYRMQQELLPIGGKIAKLPKVEWLGSSDRKIDTVLKDQDPERGKLAKTISWLKNFLSAGARRSTEVISAGEKEGHSRRTIWRAKDHLDITARGGGGQSWWWELPTKPSHGESAPAAPSEPQAAYDPKFERICACIRDFKIRHNGKKPTREQIYGGVSINRDDATKLVSAALEDGRLILDKVAGLGEIDIAEDNQTG